MRLKQLQKQWDAFGRLDPYWAVLTRPDMKGNRWPLDEFFQSGEDEVAELLARLETLGFTPKRGRALDFGCGVGRVTQALARRFDEVVGVDIAPSMIEHARRHNRHGDRCTFVLSASSRLAFDSASFDFVYSKLVLQHVPPPGTRRYLREFVRVLGDEGLLVFQLPEPPQDPPVLGGALKRRLPMPIVRLYRRARRAWREFPRMESYGVERREVARLIERTGGVLAAVVEDRSNDTPGFTYFVTKTHGAGGGAARETAR